MSKQKIYQRAIYITIAIYALAMVGMFIGVAQYIEHKDQRLHAELNRKVTDAFNGKNRIFDIVYSGYKVGYESMKIPAKSVAKDYDLPGIDKKDANNVFLDIKEEWESKYGDLYKMYRIKWGQNEWRHTWDNGDGWRLIELSSDWYGPNNGIRLSWYFPYAVGYKKQEYSWGYDFVPSVQRAVDEAFEFFTTNSKSNFIENLEKGSGKRIFNEVGRNEYYYLRQDEFKRTWPVGVPIDKEKKEHTAPIDATYMYNGYYKVFVAMTQYETWTVTKYEFNPDISDRNKLWTNWSIGLSIAFFIILIPLLIVDSRRQTLIKEDIYDKLLRECNPSNFMKDYDKEKIDKSNVIYQELLNTDRTDSEKILRLSNQANEALNISLINDEAVQDLMERTNPQRFTNPYNAEKVSLANDLYSRLQAKNLTYSDFLNIKNEARKLD